MIARDDELEVLKEQNGTERRWLPVGSNWQVRMASSCVRGPGYSKSDGGAIPYTKVREVTCFLTIEIQTPEWIYAIMMLAFCLKRTLAGQIGIGCMLRNWGTILIWVISKNQQARGLERREWSGVQTTCRDLDKAQGQNV